VFQDRFTGSMTHDISTWVGHAFVFRRALRQPVVSLTESCDSPESRQEFTFRQETISGWTIHFECPIEYLPGLMETIINEMAEDLDYVNSVLPEEIVARLQATQFYVVASRSAKPTSIMKSGCGGAVFMSPNHGLRKTPEAYRGSIVVNANCWIYTREEQPAGLTLHELAHAWHCMNWPCFEGDIEIRRAYEAALAADLYGAVEKPGGIGLGYATTNRMEYFAELTEAWFWENEQYPFNREQLLEHDPAGAAMLEAAWSVAP